MTKQIVGSTLATMLALGLFIPQIVRADEAPPPDAPYQETIEQPAQAEPEPAAAEPVPEEVSPTLPVVHASPMTPVNPTLQPTIYNTGTPQTAEPIQNSAAMGTQRPRLVLNLALTFTPQAMRQSPIWSNF